MNTPAAALETAPSILHKLWFGTQDTAKDVDRAAALKILEAYISEKHDLILANYTITPTYGCWSGGSELGFTLEALLTPTAMPFDNFAKRNARLVSALQDVAQWYKVTFNQAAVLYTRQSVEYAML